MLARAICDSAIILLEESGLVLTALAPLARKEKNVPAPKVNASFAQPNSQNNIPAGAGVLEHDRLTEVLAPDLVPPNNRSRAGFISRIFNFVGLTYP